MNEDQKKTVNFGEKIPHYNPQGFGDKFKKALITFVVIAAAAIVAGGSTYQIREQEQAVLTTLGKAQAVTEPGLHFKIPVIQQVQKVNTTIQGFAIGYDHMGGGCVIHIKKLRKIVGIGMYCFSVQV